MVIDIAISVILFLMSIAVLVTIHVCLAWRASERGGFDIDATTTIVVERSGSRRPNMSLDDIRKLPSFDYQVEEETGKVIPMDCAVCLENFKLGEICRLLPNCSHSFHAACIDSWLSKTAVCPVCRTDANLANIGEQSRNPSEVGVELV